MSDAKRIEEIKAHNAIIDELSACSASAHDRKLARFERVCTSASAHINTQMMALAEKDREIERLRDIVGRLPVTADGVPIVPGMNVWRKGTADFGQSAAFELTVLNVRDDRTALVIDSDDESGYERGDKLWSSVEAIRAALIPPKSPPPSADKKEEASK